MYGIAGFIDTEITQQIALAIQCLCPHSRMTRNQVILGDIPGVITESDLGRTGAEILGGLGGADGTELIGPTPISDPLFPFGYGLTYAKGGTVPPRRTAEVSPCWR